MVTWRIALTAFYAIACGALLALENFNPGMSDVPLLVAWLAAPVVGFLVGRWWVLLVVLAALVGRAIGWDAGENDGNSAFWWPYLLMTTVFFGGPLLWACWSPKYWKAAVGARPSFALARVPDSLVEAIPSLKAIAALEPPRGNRCQL